MNKSVKVITRYKCEMCGTEYNNEREAENCKAFHQAPVKVEPLQYMGKHDFKKPFPFRVIVTVEGGKKALYQYTMEV